MTNAEQHNDGLHQAFTQLCIDFHTRIFSNCHDRNLEEKPKNCLVFHDYQNVKDRMYLANFICINETIQH